MKELARGVRSLALPLLIASAVAESRLERIDWLRENAVPIASVDPSDEDFSDLQPLKEIIGDTRVVQLGEQSHGDGVVFLLKGRLIKFLHQEMGFDVIAFESGLYDCRKAWELLQKGKDPLEAVGHGVFGIWTGSAQVRPLIDYLGECVFVERPLELAGFDCQFTGKASAEWLLEDLEAFLGTVREPLLDGDEWSRLASTLGWLISPKVKGDALDQERRIASLDRLVEVLEDDRLAAVHEASELAFWQQLAASSLGQAKQVLDEQPGGRDIQMGENLVWLARQRYPDRKIIVWAATMHSCRNAKTISWAERPGIYDDTVTMGDVAARELGDDLFTIGFGAYRGSAGAWHRKAFDIGAAPKSSLEELMVAAGFENALVGLRDLPPDGEWLRKRHYARPLGHADMRADWTQVLDAYIVNKTMTPSTREAATVQSTRAPRAMSRREADAARDLLTSLAGAWTRIQVDLEKDSRWVEQSDFLTAYGKWRKVVDPDREALAAARDEVKEWLSSAMDDAELQWRGQHLLAAMAERLEDPEARALHLDLALSTMTVRDHRRPSEHGRFHHLVNDRAMLTWSADGLEAALEFAAGMLETDARFRYFATGPWVQRLLASRRPQDVETVSARVRTAYEKRAQAFPELARECRRFARKLR